MITIDDFTIRNVFYKSVNADGDVLYWRSCIPAGEGYMTVYPNGTSHHTYHNPENYWGPVVDHDWVLG